jgi:hypothetical protein
MKDSEVGITARASRGVVDDSRPRLHGGAL